MDGFTSTLNSVQTTIVNAYLYVNTPSGEIRNRPGWSTWITRAVVQKGSLEDTFCQGFALPGWTNGPLDQRRKEDEGGRMGKGRRGDAERGAWSNPPSPPAWPAKNFRDLDGI